MTELGTVGRTTERPTVPMASEPSPHRSRGKLASALARVRILAPLRRRNFGLLWAGMTVSLVGDGIYAIAVVWEALRLSNSATSVSLVGVAWTVPTLACLLFSGILTDRFDRRRLMLCASLVQAGAVGIIGVLDVTGHLQPWALLGLIVVYGTAEAFFLPAFEALVPMLVTSSELAQASALDQAVRPLTMRLIGPALGGLLIAMAGTAAGFLLDAGTFFVSAATLLAMRPAGGPAAPHPGHRATLSTLREGIRFVRANPWLWRTLLAASVTLLLFLGPYEVVLPFLVKNGLHGGSATLGLIRAFGGIGALLGALAVSQSGLPRRALRAMFAGWALQCLTLAGYAAAHRAWLFAVVSLLGGACGAVGNVVWGTFMKTRVPNHLLGRVASLDLLVSIGLVPVSFALAGPAAALIGARATLLGGGVVAAGVLLAALFLCRAEGSPARRATRDHISQPARAS
ncbi:MAG TPA: MFS transporter [Solirubrobacteraceae bacterium]|nr:MFS transporter [Solirubrobacteraceae bacterium]